MKAKPEQNETLKILCLEDSPKDVEIMRELLIDAGYTIQIDFTDKENEFVSFLRNHKYNIILSDFKLAGFDGFTALRLAVEICPDVPFICVSGTIGEEAAVELLKMGAADYVMKDRLKRLPAAIKRALKETQEKELRRLAQLSLQESENRWRSLVRTIPDYIALFDKNATYLFLNHYAEGFSEEDVVGRSAQDFISKESKIHYMSEFETAMNTGEIVNLEYDGYGSGGTIRKYDSFFVPVKENDQFLYMLVLARDITERKQAEEALRNSEERYRMLVTFSPDPLYVHVENFIKLVNPALCHLLGADNPSQLIGKSIFEIIHPEYHEIVRERLSKVFNDQPAMLLDEKFIRLDGTIVDVEVNAVAIDWQGSRGVQVIARNITERKRIEEKIQFQNVILSTQQEASIDGILVVGEAGNLISYNQRFLEIWSVSPSLLEKNNLESILAVIMDKMGDTSSFLQQVQYLNEHFKETSRDDIVFKDGRIFDRYSAPMLGPDKKYYGRVWYFRDITERKQFEENIINERKMLRTLIDNLPDTIYVKDINCCKIIANLADVKFVGYNEEADILGKTDLELFLGSIGERGYADDKEVIYAGRSIIEREENFVDNEGHIRWLLTSKIPLSDKNGRISGLVGIGRNITERKRAEQELIKAKEKAEENDRLKTAFLHNISHEVRTPMNAIVGFSQLLNDSKLPTDKRKHFTDIIVQSSNQLLSIISDIISISTLEVGQERIQEKVINVNAICKLLYAEFLSKAVDRNITLRIKTDLSDDAAEISSDETKLIQILTNLISNGLKFTKQGYVNFGYKIKELQDTEAQLEFFIEDTGIGIAPEMFEEIFERFRQVDSSATREYGGSGLGLSISKAYIELLGGKIWLKSEPDKGSTFYFTIPYRKVQKNILLEKQPIIAIDTEIEEPKTLLIAEDEDSNFMLLEELLSDINFNLIRVINGFEAIEICKTNKHIDLILMDLKMPIMNGFDATKQIREFMPYIPIIAQTAYTSDFDKKKAFECGCSDFVSKPYKQELLIAKIYAQLNKK
jgi:PAS domain S-box-containing protein